MGIMKIASPIWGSSSSTAMGLTVTAIAIAVILLASNFTVINAQQSLTSQPGEIENGATTTASAIPTTTAFQSTNDSFSIQVPDDWVIQDLNNSGSALLEETTRGYGILAQLCPEEEEQQQQQGAALPNTNSGSTNSSSSNSTNNVCQGSEEMIHIIRYPDLDTRIQPASNITTTTNNNMTTDDVVSYHLQKLQEVGYRSMQIVNSTETTLNLTNAQTNQPIAIVPAKIVEMAYNKPNSAPNEIRKGYFISTATNATAPNLGTTKGYAVFYEGNSTTISTAAAIQTTTAASSGSLAPTVLPPAVGQVFGSFELIAAAEVGQEAAQAAETAEGDDDGANDDDDNGSDNDDNDDDDDDDNGSDNDDNDDDDDDDNGSDNDDNDDDDDDDNGSDNDDNDDDDNGSDNDDNDDDDDDDNGSDNDDGISSRGPEHASDDYDGDDDDGANDDDDGGDDYDGGDDDGA
jgi:hypothetical protein